MSGVLPHATASRAARPAAWLLRATTALLILAASTPALTQPAAATAASAAGRMNYTGELIDEGGTPISGVFPITFKLYETERATNALWAERHYTAVMGGAYDVALGAAAPIPAALDGRDLFMAVEIGSIGELLRQRVTVRFTPPPPTREEVIARLNLTFADVADRALVAVEAEKADDCLRLDGRSLADLDRYDEMLGQVAQLRDQLDTLTGARLGTRTTTLERVGGAGGNPYSRTCPPGHVVTGVRGGAGAFLDSIELICSPLQ